MHRVVHADRCETNGWRRWSTTTKLAVESAALGWLDDQALLLRLGDDVVAWDYESGQLQHISALDDRTTVSFAPSLVE